MKLLVCDVRDNDSGCLTAFIELSPEKVKAIREAVDMAGQAAEKLDEFLDLEVNDPDPVYADDVDWDKLIEASGWTGPELDPNDCYNNALAQQVSDRGHVILSLPDDWTMPASASGCDRASKLVACTRSFWWESFMRATESDDETHIETWEISAKDLPEQ